VVILSAERVLHRNHNATGVEVVAGYCERAVSFLQAVLAEGFSNLPLLSDESNNVLLIKTLTLKRTWQ
jgi:hypothetical protein